MSKKSEKEGLDERLAVLQRYLGVVQGNEISEFAKTFSCQKDDIVDAICLAVTANLVYAQLLIQLDLK